MNNIEEKSENWKAILLMIVISILVVGCIEFGRSMNRQSKKQISKEINNLWLEELNNRGLIVRRNGGFTWRNK